MRYAHQGGQNPPIIVIHGNALDAIDANYKRYLEKHFRETFSLVGTPLRIELRSGKNPYATSVKNSMFVAFRVGNQAVKIDYSRHTVHLREHLKIPSFVSNSYHNNIMELL